MFKLLANAAFLGTRSEIAEIENPLKLQKIEKFAFF